MQLSRAITFWFFQPTLMYNETYSMAVNFYWFFSLCLYNLLLIFFFFSIATEYHLGVLKAKLAKYRSQLLEPAGKKEKVFFYWFKILKFFNNFFMWKCKNITCHSFGIICVLFLMIFNMHFFMSCQLFVFRNESFKKFFLMCSRVRVSMLWNQVMPVWHLLVFHLLVR